MIIRLLLVLLAVYGLAHTTAKPVNGGPTLSPGGGSSTPTLAGSGDPASGWLLRVILYGITVTPTSGGDATPVPVTRSFLSTISGDASYHTVSNHFPAPLLPSIGNFLGSASATFVFDTNLDPNAPPAMTADTLRIQLSTNGGVFTPPPALSSGPNATVDTSALYGVVYNVSHYFRNESQFWYSGSGVANVPCSLQSGILKVPLLIPGTAPTAGDADEESGGGSGGDDTPSADVQSLYTLTMQFEWNPYVCTSYSPVYRGTRHLIHWAASYFTPRGYTSSQSYVKLALRRESDPAFNLPLTSQNGAIQNTGSFTWAVPTDLAGAVGANANGGFTRLSFNDLYIVVTPASSPNAPNVPVPADWINVSARSARFSMIAPIPDAARGVEETILVRPLTVAGFVNSNTGPNGDWTSETQFYVKMFFSAGDYRISPIKFTGQNFATPTIMALYMPTNGGNSVGYVSPRLTAHLFSSSDTASVNATSYVGWQTRPDARQGFFGQGVRQLTLTGLTTTAGTMTFNIDWSYIVYSPVAGAIWTIDSRSRAAGGTSGGDSFTVRWVPESFLDPISEQDQSVPADSKRIWIYIRHRTIASINIPIGPTNDNQNGIMDRVSGARNSGQLTFSVLDDFGNSNLPTMDDSNAYYLYLETPYSRVSGLNISARSDYFIIRSPNPCTILRPCAPGNSTCTNQQVWGYTCRCVSGFTGTPDATVKCLDINECATNNGGCDPLQPCTNLLGGAECGDCPASTADSPFGCQAYSSSAPCSGFQCMANGHCVVSNAGTPECVCNSGFQQDVTSLVGRCVVASALGTDNTDDDSGTTTIASYYLIGSGALMFFTLGTFALYYCVWKSRQAALARRNARIRQAAVLAQRLQNAAAALRRQEEEMKRRGILPGDPATAAAAATNGTTATAAAGGTAGDVKSSVDAAPTAAPDSTPASGLPTATPSVPSELLALPTLPPPAATAASSVPDSTLPAPVVLPATAAPPAVTTDEHALLAAASSVSTAGGDSTGRPASSSIGGGTNGAGGAGTASITTPSARAGSMDALNRWKSQKDAAAAAVTASGSGRTSRKAPTPTRATSSRAARPAPPAATPVPAVVSPTNAGARPASATAAAVTKAAAPPPPAVATSASALSPRAAPTPTPASPVPVAVAGQQIDASSNNIQVVCRFRPQNELEIKTDGKLSTDPAAATASGNKIQLHGTTGVHIDDHKFSFDRVFPLTGSQSETYESVAQPMVQSILNGYNCTIFAYGQTGSGKTHTMMGKLDTPALHGIIPRLMGDLFTSLNAQRDNSQINYSVGCSMVEIYMERIRDLLGDGGGGGSADLKIREGKEGVWIQDVTEVEVHGVADSLEVLSEGIENRSVASTLMNAESSRSHSVLIVLINQTHSVTGSKKTSKLFLVDLAGSEKSSKTGATGTTFDEAKAINKSLSALGNVINALSSGDPNKFVPYRDSKLTRLLSDSLGGNSKTCLIITCSPSSYNLQETISTLRFGTRAKKITNKATVNSEKSVLEYLAIIQALETEIAALRVELATYRNGGIPPPVGGSAAAASADAKSTAAPASATAGAASGNPALPAAVSALVLPSADVVAELSRRVAEYEAELQAVNASHAVFRAKVDLTEREYLNRIESLSALSVAQSMDAAAAAAQPPAAAGGSGAAPAAAADASVVTSLRAEVATLTERNRELEASVTAANAAVAAARAAALNAGTGAKGLSLAGSRATPSKVGFTSQTMQLTGDQVSAGTINDSASSSVGPNGTRATRTMSSAVGANVAGARSSVLIRRTVNLGVVNNVQNEAQSAFDRFQRGGTAAGILQRTGGGSGGSTRTLLAGALTPASVDVPQTRGSRSMSVSAMLAAGASPTDNAFGTAPAVASSSSASGVVLSAEEKRAIESRLRHQMVAGVRRVSVNSSVDPALMGGSASATPVPSSKQLQKELFAELRNIEATTSAGTGDGGEYDSGVVPAAQSIRRRSSAIAPPRRSSASSSASPPVSRTSVSGAGAGSGATAGGGLTSVTEERSKTTVVAGSTSGDSKSPPATAASFTVVESDAVDSDSDSQHSGEDELPAEDDDTALAQAALLASEEATLRRLNVEVRRTGIPDLKQGRDYFCLTVAAILQRALDTGVISDTRHELWAFELFEVCLSESVPFSQWHEWTTNRIGKIIIERRKNQQTVTHMGGVPAAIPLSAPKSGGAGPVVAPARGAAGPIATGGSGGGGGPSATGGGGRGAGGAGGNGGGSGTGAKKDEECAIM